MWQNFMQNNDPTNVFTVIVNQTARAFGATTEAQALFKNLQGKNNDSANKVSRAEEEATKTRSEAEEAKRLCSKESAKLTSALTKIKSLRKEVRTCQSEVASMTRRVETSDAHQRIASKALKRIN